MLSNPLECILSLPVKQEGFYYVLAVPGGPRNQIEHNAYTVYVCEWGDLVGTGCNS